jgi:CRP-like cAMP-binding protein
MISPELLRRYRFFGLLNDHQQKAMAMISKEATVHEGDVLFEEGQLAEGLYFLLEGCIDLYYKVEGAFSPPDFKEIPVCQVNIGEPFGISTLIEPYVLTSTARSTNTSRVLRFDGNALRELFMEDPELELLLLRQVAKTAVERLHATRTQLAAAWA